MKKLISSLFLFTLSINFVAAQVSTWDQNSAYTKGEIAINSGKNYTALQDVPAGTAITSSAYWKDIDELMPELAKNNEKPAGLDTVISIPVDTLQSQIATLKLPPDVNATTDSDTTGGGTTGAIGQVAIDDPDLAETSTGTRIINISTRGKVVGSQDDDALVGGFVVRGTPGSTIRLIIRGLGPYMSGSIDSSLLLADPIIEVYDNSQQLIAKNDDWKVQYSNTDPDPSTTLNNGSYEVYTNQFAGGVGLNDKEAGVLLDLPIYNDAQATAQGVTGFAGYGIYTVILKGVGGTTGVGQVAIDDPDLTDNGSGNRIINISTRGFVGTGTYEDLVGGYVLKGPAGGKKNFIMRGLGPYMKLTQNKDIYLTDPFMTVEKGQTVIGSSDNWATKYSANDPEPSTTLNNGNYTAYTSGFAGVGLQEKEAGLLMEMEIDSSIGFGIYTNTVKYSAP